MGGGKMPKFDAERAITAGTQANQQAAQATQGFANQAAADTYKYAQDAFGKDWAMDTIGQDNPFGELNYTASIDPITGLPKYKATQRYSPEQQALLDQLQQSQLGIGQTAGQAVANTFGQYAGDPNLIGGATSLTSEAMNAMEPMWERSMAPERNNRRTELLNQGIMEGTPLFDREMAKVSDRQLQSKGSWMANYQPTAFGMAKDQYQLPMENVIKMLSASGPVSFKDQIINTPTNQLGGPTVNSATQAPVDALGAYKTQYESQVKAQEAKNALRNALLSGGVNVAGAAAGFPIGGSTAFNALKGMFGGNQALHDWGAMTNTVDVNGMMR